MFQQDRYPVALHGVAPDKALLVRRQAQQLCIPGKTPALLKVSIYPALQTHTLQDARQHFLKGRGTLGKHVFLHDLGDCFALTVLRVFPQHSSLIFV